MILAVTGHRPDKLGGYSKQVDERLRDLAYDYLHMDNYEQVLTGMALGWDTAVAEACARSGVPFVAVLPFKGQELRWAETHQQRYRALLQKAKRVHYPSPGGGYAPWKFQARNIWMVNHCDKLCALWDGSSGGTANCVKYAASIGRATDNLWDQWLQ